MLFFADYTLLNTLKNIKNIHLINFSSFVESKIRINLLPPQGVDYWSKDFDIGYANFLLSDRRAFVDLMKYIVAPLKCGEDVCILVTFDDGGPFDAITESIQKFMLGRYGYNSFMVKDEYDLTEALHTRLGSFTVSGIQFADKDINQYSLLRVQNMSIEEVSNYSGF